MQLDSHLVERFHALHRQKRSGLLEAVGPVRVLGICLAEGEPVAIDLGVGLETAFAQACRTYHKIDDAALAELTAALAGGAKAREYLVAQQLVSEAEAEQIGQAVVEDALTEAFRGPCADIRFHEGRTADQLAVGDTALRMRIGVEQLIRTCDQRVAEQRAVEREVGTADAVFALSEGEHGSGLLGEYEKMVLNFIDGRSTVEQIAELCRDSSLNLGRVLRALLAKRVIARVQRQTSGVRQAVTRPTADGAAPAGAGSAGAAPRPIEMTPYRSQPEPERRGLLLVGLVALLAIVAVVGWLVIDYNRTQAQFRRDEDEVQRRIAARNWNEASETVETLRRRAGNDIAAIRTVEALTAQVEAALRSERTAIAALIAGEDFAAARQRLAALPDPGALVASLREAEAAERAEAEALGAEVRTRLGSGDIAGALAAIDGATGRRAAAAEQVLATWREDSLGLARSANHSLAARLAAVARLRQSRPDAALEPQLGALEAALQAQVRELAAKLSALEAQAVAGAWRETQAELAGMRIGELGVGSEVETRAARVAAAAAASSARLLAAWREAAAALAAGAGAETLEAARARLTATIQALPQASGRASFERLAGALAACAGGGPRTAAERAVEAETLASQAPAEEAELVAALQARAAALRAIEEQARLSLEEARRLGRSGDWPAAVAALEGLVRKPVWQLTAVRHEAEQELDGARAHAARRQQLKDELAGALRRGDTAACEAIAREIGLAYLPLVVATVPAGAEVVGADGAVLGRTPAVLDISADARVDLRLTLRHPGYRTAEVLGAQADGGWRLSLRLEREPAMALRSGHPLTALPAVVDGALVLADRGQAVILPKVGAALRRVPLTAAAALTEPVFAPAVRAGDAILLATRERLAVRIDGAAAARLPLAAGTDLAPLSFRSQLILDRDLLIVAGRDGRLVAGQRATGAPVWSGAPGAAIVAAVLADGQIRVVRADGRLELVGAEDGAVLRTAAAPGRVLAAWVDGTTLHGIGPEAAWRWAGAEVSRDALPEPCIAGGPGVAVTTLGRVLLAGASGWHEVGRLPARPDGAAIAGAVAWSGHAAVAIGSRLEVFGPSPFSLDAGSDVLPPVLWGGHLVAASLEGGVWIYRP